MGLASNQCNFWCWWQKVAAVGVVETFFPGTMVNIGVGVSIVFLAKQIYGGGAAVLSKISSFIEWLANYWGKSFQQLAKEAKMRLDGLHRCRCDGSC